MSEAKPKGFMYRKAYFFFCLSRLCVSQNFFSHPTKLLKISPKIEKNIV